MTTLNVGVPGVWGELVPSLQHTAYADAILSNQFESLVRIGTGGVVEPLAAKSWEIKDGFKTFVFKIDLNRKFSNGESLKAKDFKESWEHALSLIPKSSNNSLQDVLYKVEGFEDYETKKSISGLKVKGDDTFVIKFKEPFRTALVALTGSRMAVFKINNKEYLGTGAYKIESENEDKVYLSKNPFSSVSADFDKVVYQVVMPDRAVDALNSGKISLYIFAEKTQFDDCQNNTGKIACFLGGESRHSTLILNGKKGRVFENSDYRKAFQALVVNGLNKESIPEHLNDTIIVDPQIYLPLQKGRLEDSKAKEIVDSGKPLIDDFLNYTKKSPLKMYVSKTNSWLLDFVKSLGVTLSEDSKVYPGKKILEVYYKSFESDILAGGLGVFSGDPDGIYHALGKDGSITSPMSYREGLSKKLEEGRKILEVDKIHPAYKKVSETALKEVPFVHLGFLKTRMAYRKDLIKVKKNVKSRSDDTLTTFTPI